MENYDCDLCDYHTTKKSHFDQHLRTQKHVKNIEESKKVIHHKYYSKKVKKIKKRLDLNDENNIKEIINEKALINAKAIINSNLNSNEILIEKIDMMSEEIKLLKQTNAQNTNKIIKETRAVKKSLITLLNMNFKNNPSISYIDEEEFRKELEIEYKGKIETIDCTLQLKILRDYESKYLMSVLSKLILKFIKKDDVAEQAVFNIDSSRGNYATKIDDIWHNDKTGLQLKKYTLEVIIKYMLNVLDILRLKIIKTREENIKKSSESKSDYIMKYSTLLLEVNAFLSNPKTHKQIILNICPELRFEQKILELIN